MESHIGSQMNYAADTGNEMKHLPTENGIHTAMDTDSTGEIAEVKTNNDRRRKSSDIQMENEDEPPQKFSFYTQVNDKDMEFPSTATGQIHQIEGNSKGTPRILPEKSISDLELNVESPTESILSNNHETANKITSLAANIQKLRENFIQCADLIFRELYKTRLTEDPVNAIMFIQELQELKLIHESLLNHVKHKMSELGVVSNKIVFEEIKDITIKFSKSRIDFFFGPVRKSSMSFRNQKDMGLLLDIFDKKEQSSMDSYGTLNMDLNLPVAEQNTCTNLTKRLKILLSKLYFKQTEAGDDYLEVNHASLQIQENIFHLLKYMKNFEFMTIPDYKNIFQVDGNLDYYFLHYFAQYPFEDEDIMLYPSSYGIECIMQEAGLKFMSKIMDDKQKRRIYFLFLKSQEIKYFSDFFSRAPRLDAHLDDEFGMDLTKEELSIKPNSVTDLQDLMKAIFRNNEFCVELENYLEKSKSGEYTREQLIHEYPEISVVQRDLVISAILFVQMGNDPGLMEFKFMHKLLFSIISWAVQNYGKELFEDPNIPPTFWEKYDTMYSSSQILAAMDQMGNYKIRNMHKRILSNEEYPETKLKLTERFNDPKKHQELYNYFLISELKQYRVKL
ncbi:hypothetical protein PGT21_033399 [Puccinia graminis f. sp. tritici]|uniref:Uncharacterized protein n=1 Tax=Puccinia graminis f. sp. tritici TaxID=56615 RepID=A0A5B0QKA4_PUCGR|nr:hypothetical protein PGT21_033399 [Puccinia graminis f. sp. tritici]